MGCPEYQSSSTSFGIQYYRSNPVGFEWIMMDKVLGKPWADIWHEILFSDKEKIIRQLAGLCSDNFQRQLTSIGSLFPDSDVIEFPLNSHDSHNFKVQRLAHTIANINYLVILLENIESIAFKDFLNEHPRYGWDMLLL
jgi:hypothetical protein